MMFDLAIIDLDHTLYDTGKMYQGIVRTFIESGAKREDIIDTAKLADDRSSGVYDYHPYKHACLLSDRVYGFDVKMFEEYKIQEDFMYADAYSFLESLRQYCQKIILLTAGNREFQLQKLESTKIVKFVDEINIVAGQKEKFLASHSGKIFFFNDNLDENMKIASLYPRVHIVSKYRNKYTENQYEKSGLPVVNDFDECLRLFKS